MDFSFELRRESVPVRPHLTVGCVSVQNGNIDRIQLFVPGRVEDHVLSIKLCFKHILIIVGTAAYVVVRPNDDSDYKIKKEDVNEELNTDPKEVNYVYHKIVMKVVEIPGSTMVVIKIIVQCLGPE